MVTYSTTQSSHVSATPSVSPTQPSTQARSQHPQTVQLFEQPSDDESVPPTPISQSNLQSSVQHQSKSKQPSFPPTPERTDLKRDRNQLVHNLPLLHNASNVDTHSVEPTRSFPAIALLKQQVPCITTASQALNAALNPGLHPGRVTQFCGHSLSGKTALALEFAKSVLLSGNGVIWFESTHSSWEIETKLSILMSQSAHDRPENRSAGSPDRFPTDEASSFSKALLTVIPVPTLSDTIRALSAVNRDVRFLRLLQDVPCTSATNNKLLAVLRKMRLIVFDAAATILSPVLGLRLPPCWTGHVALEHVCVLLRSLAIETNAAVITTNRLVGSSEPPHAALGAKWATFVDVSVHLIRDQSKAQPHPADVDTGSGSTTVTISAYVTSKIDVSRVCRIAITDRGAVDADADADAC